MGGNHAKPTWPEAGVPGPSRPGDCELGCNNDEKETRARRGTLPGVATSISANPSTHVGDLEKHRLSASSKPKETWRCHILSRYFSTARGQARSPTTLRGENYHRSAEQADFETRFKKAYKHELQRDLPRCSRPPPCRRPVAE